MKRPNLKDVIKRQRTQVMKLPGVAGIAVGLSSKDKRKPCIQVYVTVDQWPDGLPRQFDGYAVELVRTSGFRAI
jgi:hypothetical protein